MKSLQRFFARLSNLAAGSRADQRLREEMEEHLARKRRTISAPACLLPKRIARPCSSSARSRQSASSTTANEACRSSRLYGKICATHFA
jgi:hypothetical protein